MNTDTGIPCAANNMANALLSNLPSPEALYARKKAGEVRIDKFRPHAKQQSFIPCRSHHHSSGKRLLSKVSAIDHEFGACHEARLVGGKEKAAVCDF